MHCCTSCARRVDPRGGSWPSSTNASGGRCTPTSRRPFSPCLALPVGDPARQVLPPSTVCTIRTSHGAHCETTDGTDPRMRPRRVLMLVADDDQVGRPLVCDFEKDVHR